MENIGDVENFLQKKDGVSKHIKSETNKFDDLQKMLLKEERVYLEVSKNISGKDLTQSIFLCDPLNASDVVVALARRISAQGVLPIIILTTMNYKSARKALQKVGLEDKVFLIDTVSKNISFVKDMENIWFVDSLRNLTQLQIKIVKLIKTKKNVAFVFDALNVLELYHSRPILLKFTYSVSKLLKKYKLGGYYSITKPSLAPKLSQFFDNFAEIKKIE